MSEVEHIGELFRVDPAEFVTARNQLARRLKDAGDPDSAAEVRALRKPSKTAWALNVWAHAEPHRVEELLATAAEVARAQRSGGQPLRDATTAYTDAVASAVDSAAQRSGVDGESMRQRLRATLLAAGADPQGGVASQLRAGALRADADAPGFSFGSAELTSEPTEESTRPGERTTGRTLRSVPDPAPGADPTQNDRARAAHDDARERAAAAERARVARARKDQIRAARRDVERLRARAERLDHRAAEAEAQAAEARAGADAASSDLGQALDRLAELTGD